VTCNAPRSYVGNGTTDGDAVVDVDECGAAHAASTNDHLEHLIDGS
jgi:hypothetical protein